MARDFFDKILDDVKQEIKGKKIVDVRYMTDAEVCQLHRYTKGIVIELDSGESLFLDVLLTSIEGLPPAKVRPLGL